MSKKSISDIINIINENSLLSNIDKKKLIKIVYSESPEIMSIALNDLFLQIKENPLIDVEKFIYNRHIFPTINYDELIQNEFEIFLKNYLDILNHSTEKVLQSSQNKVDYYLIRNNLNKSLLDRIKL